jgi:hypothetical protein
MTLSGVVVHGEKFTVGSETYQFAADALQTVDSGNIAVDITAHTTKAQGTLTIDTQPTATNTMRIGTTVYTFRAPADTDAAGEISIGTDLATAQANIVSALSGLDGLNVANTFVTCSNFAADICTLTARIGGVAANSYVTTETFSALTNIFDAGTLGTLTPGVDCTAPNAVTHAVAAITANSAIMTAVDGANDTIVCSYVEVGTEGNDITVTKTITNGTWGAQVTKLSGGLYATPAYEKSYIIVAGTWYIATKVCDKYSTDCWYSCIPALIA